MIIQRLLRFLSSKGFLNFIILFVINIFLVVVFSNIIYIIYGFFETSNVNVNKGIYGIIISSYILIYLFFFIHFFYLFDVWKKEEHTKMYLGTFVNLYLFISLGMFIYYFFNTMPEYLFLYYFYILPLIPGIFGFIKGFGDIPVTPIGTMPSRRVEETDTYIGTGGIPTKQAYDNDFFSQKSNNKESEEVVDYSGTGGIPKDNSQEEDFFSKKKKESDGEKEGSILGVLKNIFSGDKDEQPIDNNPFAHNQTSLNDNDINKEEDESEYIEKNPFTEGNFNDPFVEEETDDSIEINPFLNDNITNENLGDIPNDDEEVGDISDTSNKNNITHTNIANLDLDEILQNDNDLFSEEFDLIDADKIDSGEFFDIDEDDDDYIFTTAIPGTSPLNVSDSNTDGDNNTDSGNPSTNNQYDKYYIKNMPMEKTQDKELLEKLINVL